jgi:protein gp37
MGENTKITWCHHTFNPWWGCEKVSAGCANCYAEAWAKRCGFDVFGPDKPRRFFEEQQWKEPLKWDADAAEAGERRRVFCGSMCDVFEGDDSGTNETDYGRDALWNLIDETPNLDWLLLTKRPQNIEIMTPSEWCYPEAVAEQCKHMSARAGEKIVPNRPLGWPENVWALTTVENQEVVEARLAPLLQLPATIRGLSMEPLLGPVDFYACLDRRLLNWLIIGCEKLPGNRPGRKCELAWVRNLAAQARDAGVAVFVKQLEVAGRVSADPADWPEDLRIQEFPR